MVGYDRHSEAFECKVIVICLEYPGRQLKPEVRYYISVRQLIIPT